MMLIYLILGITLGWTLRSLYASVRKYQKHQEAIWFKHELQRKWRTWYQIKHILYQEEEIMP